MAQNADAEALFAAHETGLLRYLRRAVGHAETARDLTQDVFVRIAGAGALPATEGERRAWIFRIARNLAIDHHRRHEVKLAVEIDGASHSDDGRAERDQRRDAWVLDQGIRTLRLSASSVMGNLGGALDAIYRAARG